MEIESTEFAREKADSRTLKFGILGDWENTETSRKNVVSQMVVFWLMGLKEKYIFWVLDLGKLIILSIICKYFYLCPMSYLYVQLCLTFISTGQFMWFFHWPNLFEAHKNGMFVRPVVPSSQCSHANSINNYFVSISPQSPPPNVF